MFHTVLEDETCLMALPSYPCFPVLSVVKISYLPFPVWLRFAALCLCGFSGVSSKQKVSQPVLLFSAKPVSTKEVPG